jgi:hypothetical protein
MAMSRPLSAVWLAAVFLTRAVPVLAAEPDTLARATALLDRQDGRAAAAVLEDALPKADAETRHQLLQGLRRAYALAIRQAEADGRDREATLYRENLAILDRVPPGATTSSPASARNSEAAPPAPPRSLSADPAPALSAGDAPTEPTEAPRPSSPGREAPTAPPSTAGETGDRAAAPSPGGADAGATRGGDTDDPDPKPADVADADAAFRARRYDEAGRIYGELARKGRLPDVRRDPWAYCRMVTIVERINAAPRASHDWDAIQAEIGQIRALSPKNWYAEYLRNLVAELKAKSRPAAAGPVVLRGGSPEEEPRDEAPATRRRRFVAAATPPEEASEAQRPPSPVADDRAPGQAGQPIGTWQVWDTPNFRILHADAELAQQVARVAEAVREEQGRRWGSQQQAGERWSPRCDIYLYPTAALFREMTGQPEESPGFSTMGLNQGKVVARRVNLRVDHPNLTTAILPHEVTHVVLADLFADVQIPRWADEGMAVLSEPTSEQDLRAADLARPLAEGRLFRLADLMKMDYPDGRFWSLYYAQSVSLARYLVELGTPEQFVSFVRGTQRNSIDAELKRVYGLDGLGDLQDRWLSHVRKRPAALASSARDEGGSPRR